MGAEEMIEVRNDGERIKISFSYIPDVLKRRFVYEIKRPKEDKKLPVVLSREEVSHILSSVSNIKHKAILMLMYSAGLRVSEVVNLKSGDIDAERQIYTHVSNKNIGKIKSPLDSLQIK